MSSDEGWEEVYQDDINLIINKKEKINNLNIKYTTFSSFVKIFDEFYKEISIPQIDEFMDFNIINKMYHLIKKEENLENSQYYFTDYIKNIIFFKFLKEHKIICRIYFVLDNDKISSFLEIFVNGIIIKNKLRYKGCIFYIDTNNNVNDYTWYFSTNMKNYKIFLEVLDCFVKKNNLKEFNTLDLERLNMIPSSIIKLKHHPLFCLESELNINQVLSNKKTVQGFYKGEPVFLKKDITNLKSERYFYKRGKIPKLCDPLKIHREIKFYSEDQVEDMVVKDMNDKLIQDYLHKNHIPINCVYIKNEFDERVCKKLNIKYRKCFVGFNKQNPVYKGLFIYKKDLFIVSNFIFEYFDYNKKLEIKNRVLQNIKIWEKIVKMCKKYKVLKSRI